MQRSGRFELNLILRAFRFGFNREGLGLRVYLMIFGLEFDYIEKDYDGNKVFRIHWNSPFEEVCKYHWEWKMVGVKKLVLIGLLISSPVFAEEILVQGGWLHTGNSNYGDSAEVTLRTEKRVLRDLGVGVEYAFHGPTYHEEYGDFIGHSVLGELIYYPNVKWKIKPYILGGLGWSWWDFKGNAYLKDAGIEVDLGDARAEKFAVGADYPINKNWSFNIEWSYFHAAVPKDSYYADGSFANVLGDDDRRGEITVGHEECNLLFGLRYKF